MELRQLSTLIRAAQLQSFSKAAESLGYSQSAVTVQIRLLEEELGTRLFDRIGRKVTLTPQGSRFLTSAYDILYEVNRAKLSVSGGAELENPLHVGTIESLCFSKFPSILRYFRENHPKVAVQITTATGIRSWNRRKRSFSSPPLPSRWQIKRKSGWRSCWGSHSS